MSTAPLKTLHHEGHDDLEKTIAHLGFGLPFNEVIGQPRDMRVNDLKQRLAPTQKGRRIVVSVRH